MSEQGIGVGVGVVVLNEEGWVLLGLRKNTSLGDGEWAFPGGKVNKFENPAMAAERELYEETGLLASEFELEGVSSDAHWDAGLHYITLYYRTIDVTGVPFNREPDKCEKWAWFPLDELPERVWFPCALLLKKLLEEQNS
jgi:8-oxo-dGTP diphosphatase